MGKMGKWAAQSSRGSRKGGGLCSIGKCLRLDDQPRSEVCVCLHTSGREGWREVVAQGDTDIGADALRNLVSAGVKVSGMKCDHHLSRRLQNVGVDAVKVSIIEGASLTMCHMPPMHMTLATFIGGTTFLILG